MEGEQEKGAHEDAIRFLTSQLRAVGNRIEWVEMCVWDCKRRITRQRPRIWEIRTWCRRLQDHLLVRKLNRDLAQLVRDSFRLFVAMIAAERGEFRRTIEVLDFLVGEMTLRSKDDPDGAPSRNITLAVEFRKLKNRLMTLPVKSVKTSG